MIRKLWRDVYDGDNLLLLFHVYYLLLLTVGFVSESEENTWNIVLVWVITPLLGAMMLYRVFSSSPQIPRESIRLLIFFGYVCLGFLYAYDDYVFIKALRRVLLVMIIFITGQHLLSKHGKINTIIFIVLIAALYLCYFSFYKSAESANFNLEGGLGISGGLINLNQIGNSAVSGILAVLFFWGNLKWPYKLIPLAALPLLLLSIVGAASKAGVLGLFSTIILWTIFCLFQSKGNKLIFIILAVFILIGLDYGWEYVSENTYLGERLKIASDLDTYYKNDSRGALIREAFDLFMKHPLFGVGLMQFSFFSESAYSHNEYLEVLCNFGIIGSLIYFPFYYLIWKRLSKVKKLYPNDTKIQYNINMAKVIILVMLIRGISVPIFLSLEEMLLLAVCGGYAYFLQNQYIKQTNLISQKQHA